MKRYEAIEEQEWEEIENYQRRVDEFLNSQRYWLSARDDFEYEDLAPDGEILVEEKRIVVRAFVKGLGDRLPKKHRKHLGFGSMEYGECFSEWAFPLEMLEEVKRSGLPLLFHPDSPLAPAGDAATSAPPVNPQSEVEAISIPQSREKAEALLSVGCKDGGIRLHSWDELPHTNLRVRCEVSAVLAKRFLDCKGA